MIIAGLGGQGVFTLTKIMWSLCQKNRIKCQSSTFKGGAQKHGSIHSVLRIFLKPDKHYNMYSTQIPAGELDLILGLEPWETLRYNYCFGSKTKVFMNSRITPFYIERLSLTNNFDPVATITNFKPDALIRDFTAQSDLLFGTVKMTNFLLGLELFASGIVPFTAEEYTLVFCDQIKADLHLKDKLLSITNKCKG
jgi:Pyruvate/2-oxoacid:ferredoxin oxidoreductase gamma subunit